MQPHDLKPFSEALLATFDALGARPPGAAGIELWFRTMRGHQLADVTAALDGWVLRNRRAPTPSDLADAIRDVEIERRERQSAQWKHEERNGPYTMGATAAGRRALAEVRRMVEAMQRQRVGMQREWAHRVIDRWVDGDPVLAPIAFQFACDALHKSREDRESLNAMRDQSLRSARAA